MVDVLSGAARCIIRWEEERFHLINGQLLKTTVDSRFVAFILLLE